MADDLLSSTLDKVILIGDVGVGKTSIFTRFRTGEFESSGDQKIAEHQKKWTVNGRDVTVRRNARWYADIFAFCGANTGHEKIALF